MEYLDGIVYRALQALGCAATSTAERETANYQGRVVKRQPTTAMRRQSRLPAATRSLHVRRASPEEGSGTGASYMQLLPLVAPAPNLSRLPACSFIETLILMTSSPPGGFTGSCSLRMSWRPTTRLLGSNPFTLVQKDRPVGSRSGFALSLRWVVACRHALDSWQSLSQLCLLQHTPVPVAPCTQCHRGVPSPTHSLFCATLTARSSE